MLPLTASAQTPADRVLFKTDFESTNVDSVPEELMILAGQFSVKEIDGNKALELPGTPLEDFGALFGPAESDGVAVRARVRSESTKRLAPRFGVGLSGVSGYRLLVSPGQNALQLLKDQQVVASAPFEWKQGTWTSLQLQVRKICEGKVDTSKDERGRTELPSQKIGRYRLKSQKPHRRAKPRSGAPPIPAGQFCSTI